MSTAQQVFAFACWIPGAPWGEHHTVYNARSSGQAKVEYWRHVTDAWPGIPFTAVRARKVGPAHTSEEFKRNAAYRGMPDVRCGQRVRVGDAEGTIVGHNASANFDVLFDAGSRYGTNVLNVHPSELTLLTRRKRAPSQRAVKRLLKRYVRNRQHGKVLALQRETIHWATLARDGRCCLCGDRK